MRAIYLRPLTAKERALKAEFKINPARQRKRRETGNLMYWTKRFRINRWYR
jgi:hypothetical protein